MYRHLMSITLLLSLNSTLLCASEGDESQSTTVEDLIRSCVAKILEPLQARVTELESEVAELRQALNESQSTNTALFIPVPQEIEALLQSDIKDFTFPTRIANRIQVLGLRTVADLAQLKSTDFIVSRLVNRKSLEVLEIFLKQFGKNFADLKQPGLAPEPDSKIFKAVFSELVDSGLMSRSFSLLEHSHPKLTLGEFLSMNEKEITNGNDARDTERNLNGARTIFAKYRRVLLP